MSQHRPVRLLTGTFALASVTTAVLSLDTTVVLLTPVVHETAARLRLPPKPYVYACTHLANSASLLLPVSNLTNLLAFSVSGLSLTGFTAAMGLPWLVAIAVEYVVFRVFFRADLAAGPRAASRRKRTGRPDRADLTGRTRPADRTGRTGPADQDRRTRTRGCRCSRSPWWWRRSPGSR